MTDEEKMAVELDEKIENEMYAELEEKENLLKEKEERYLRMYAEFENYKKRTEKEKQNTALHAKADVVEMLLPVIDSMENAISIETEDENLNEDMDVYMKKVYYEVNTKLNFPIGRPTRQEREQTIYALYERGFFNLKDSIDFVSKKLFCSTSTVYRYIALAEKKK